MKMKLMHPICICLSDCDIDLKDQTDHAEFNVAVKGHHLTAKMNANDLELLSEHLDNLSLRLRAREE